MASNLDVAPTILRACGIEPPAEMKGLDLRKPEALKKRDRIFVDVYEHDSNLDKRDDMKDGLKAWVVIDGWDKLIMRPNQKELYDLKNDPDDRTDLASSNPEKVSKLSSLIERWLKATLQRNTQK